MGEAREAFYAKAGALKQIVGFKLMASPGLLSYNCIKSELLRRVLIFGSYLTLKWRVGLYFFHYGHTQRPTLEPARAQSKGQIQKATSLTIPQEI